METLWYYRMDGQKKGPILSSGVLKLYSAGVLKKSTPMWTEDFSDWVPLGKTVFAQNLSGLQTKSISRKVIPILIVIILVVAGGITGFRIWKDTHRLDGAWQGNTVINVKRTFYFVPNITLKGTTLNILYSETSLDDSASAYAYTVRKLSGSSLEVDFCGYTELSDRIIYDDGNMKKFTITFKNDDTADIDGCGGITSISRIDTDRAKSILNLN